MKRRQILRIVNVPLILLGIMLLVVAITEVIVRLEPATASVLPSSPVTIQADERLFTLMAAFNATGYDDENNEQGMHPVRQALRAALAAKALPSRQRVRLYTQMCRVIDESNCITWLLQRGAPPTFARQAHGWWVDAPACFFIGFAAALRDFYAEADIAALWRLYKPAYVAEAARYQEQIDPALQIVYDYLKVQPAPDAYVIMLPDLLNAYWRGYGPHMEKISYIVSGPSTNLNIGLLQHEVMHPIMNPLVDANLGVIEPAQTQRLWAMLKPHMPSSYPTWKLAMHECAIRAIEVRLQPLEQRERTIIQEEEEGFMLVRPLAAQLADFEQSGLTISAYMPRWFKVLNDSALQ